MDDEHEIREALQASDDFKYAPRRHLSTLRPTEYYDQELGWITYSQLDRETAENAIRAALDESLGDPVEADKQLSRSEIDLLSAMLLLGLKPELQAQVGRYRADFLFRREHVVVEVDGRKWHDWEHDRQRDRYMRLDHDLIVKRYPASRVWADPLACARDVQRTVAWISARLGRVAA